MKKILVTGGAGYIGSHAVRALINQGKEVLVIDNLEKGHREAVPKEILIEGDLRDRALLEDVFQSNPIESVMHFAADSYVGESVENPGKYYENNILSSLNLLRAMQKYGVTNIIFSSTAAVYGNGNDKPLKETDHAEPINPYGFTKHIVERMLSDFSDAHGLRFVALRYFNAAGADPNGDIGESHIPETHIIPLTLAVATGKLPMLTVFGNDYPTPDGTCLRDYVHVTDIAEAHLNAIAYLEQGGANTILNIGNNKGYSVSEVIRTARQITGKTIPATVADRRAGDPALLLCDNAFARQALNWQPKFSSLEKIIETAWRWELSRHF
ncbi:MAG: UDP-glucose 4-epimerase GalE [bacterium]|nr:UDP-glucose 4-epimerase GalE [bacterium]